MHRDRQTCGSSGWKLRCRSWRRSLPRLRNVTYGCDECKNRKHLLPLAARGSETKRRDIVDCVADPCKRTPATPPSAAEFASTNLSPVACATALQAIAPPRSGGRRYGRRGEHNVCEVVRQLMRSDAPSPVEPPHTNVCSQPSCHDMCIAAGGTVGQAPRPN